MRTWIGVGAAAAALMIAINPASAAGVIIRNAVVRVTVVPQDRQDVQVIVHKTNPKLPLTVSQGLNGDVIVDGGERYGLWGFLFGGRTTDCRRDGSEPVVHVWGVGDIRGEDMPDIEVRTPMSTHVSTGGASFGTVARSDDLDLSIAGCDQWTIANVKNKLAIHDSGAGTVHAGTAGSLSLRIAGVADVTTHDIANGLDLHVAGVGKLESSSVSGPVEIHIAGHSDVRIQGGHASTFAVHIAGSGKVDDQGTADSLNASIAGSGDINIAHVLGEVTKSIAGSGTINVGK